MTLQSLNRSFARLVVAAGSTALLAVGTQASASAKPLLCLDAYRPIHIGFVQSGGAQWEIVARHARQSIREMADELGPIRRPMFLKLIANAKGAAMASAGKSKNGRAYVNELVATHVQSLVSLVHEGQHVIDNGIGLGFLGTLIVAHNPNQVNDLETKAFEREYGLLRRIGQDPEFDVKRALTHPADTVAYDDLPYELDEPIMNEWGEPSSEFINNPAKFLKAPGVRERLRRYFVRASDDKFESELDMAMTMTKAEYVNQRLHMYEEKAAHWRKVAYLAWGNSALMAMAPWIVGFAAYMSH